MARPKGSKNKPTQEPLIDRSAEIAEKEARKAQIDEEILSLRDKMIESKTLEKELRLLKAEQEKYDEMKRKEEFRAFVNSRIDELVDSGMSAEDILARLK